MEKILPGLILVLVGSVSPAAAQWEVSLLAGWTAPTYEEQFVFSPDLSLPDDGIIRQSGEFMLKGRGSFAFGGSLAYMVNEHIGIEGRVDTINFKIDTIGPQFAADAGIATAILDVGMGSVNVERLFPLSLNLKARTGGRTRFVASGGLSYLPQVRFEAVQPVSLGIGFPGLPSVPLASVALEAGAASGEGSSRWGLNAGAGVEVQVSPLVSIVGEARFHGFESQTFIWERAGAPTTELEELLLQALETLPPIDIQLIYFQVTGGIAFRF